jgi:UDP-N-acetylglucosamine transferase subunit ALG13
MIFVTVGTQLPFDRLLNAVDGWALANPGQQIIAQTGVTEIASSRIDARPFVDVATFKALSEQSDVIVAHAGMGSILTAIELAKPVIIMPRRAELGEHRNDHQLATAENLAHLGNLRIANDATELGEALEAVLSTGPLEKLKHDISEGHRRLVGEIRNFISGAPLGAAQPIGAF